MTLETKAMRWRRWSKTTRLRGNISIISGTPTSSVVVCGSRSRYRTTS
jgi:hypothetical protein